MDASITDLSVALASLVVVALVILYVFIKVTTRPYPDIHVYDSEKTFTAFSSGNKGRSSQADFYGKKLMIFTPFLSESKRNWESSLKDGHKEADPDLSIVVPAYNEEERLPKMLDEALEFLNSTSCSEALKDFEIIVVDDGSKDKTTKMALEYARQLGCKRFRVLTLAKNLGKGGAIRRGMLVARGRTLMFADADGATKFSELNKVSSKLQEISVERNGEALGLVCGSRAHLEEESVAKRSFFRTVLMYGFHSCVRVFGAGDCVKDTQCGFKIMTRATARFLFYSLHIERWAFDVELIKIATMLNIPVDEVAVTWTEIDGSKLDPISASIQMFKDLFLLWARYFVGAWKLVSVHPS